MKRFPEVLLKVLIDLLLKYKLFPCYFTEKPKDVMVLQMLTRDNYYFLRITPVAQLFLRRQGKDALGLRKEEIQH